VCALLHYQPVYICVLHASPPTYICPLHAIYLAFTSKNAKNIKLCVFRWSLWDMKGFLTILPLVSLTETKYPYFSHIKRGLGESFVYMNKETRKLCQNPLPHCPSFESCSEFYPQLSLPFILPMQPLLLPMLACWLWKLYVGLVHLESRQRIQELVRRAVSANKGCNLSSRLWIKEIIFVPKLYVYMFFYIWSFTSIFRILSD